MEKGFPSKKKNVPPPQKEVFKELSLELRGRDSPESGSLYSDYESGQQYEQVSLYFLDEFSFVDKESLLCIYRHNRLFFI